jgi:hypothetical protein
MSESDTRVMMHVDNDTSKKFYRTGFCQGGTLLASIKPDNSLDYGVSMQHISDYGIKVFMPVNPDLLNAVAKNNEASSFLDAFVELRKMEIHPPLVETKTIIEATMAWSPVKAYVAPDEILNRDYKVCLTSTAFREPEERSAALFKALATANEWNNDPKQKQIGHLTAYEAMDSVFTRLYLWTDNTEQLQSSLSTALAKPSEV